MTKQRISISLDAMGGDYGLDVVVPAAVDFVSQDREVVLILVGDESAIRKKLGSDQDHQQIKIQHASQVVGMDEAPSKALRGKKDSSMRIAINLVKSGDADACVSAGNTGALMATSRFVLKMLPNIDRPAIISVLPSIKDHTWMLDLGANVDCSAEQLLQFALMGNAVVQLLDDRDTLPRVGLLNVGEEEIKGNEQVKKAHELLSNTDLNYIGYVEGDDIFTGDVDLVVCDGFVGNISLKTAEGVAKMVSYFLKKGFKRNVLTMVVGLLAKPVLNRLKQVLDPREHNGASLLGLRGIVIKSHGGADAWAFSNAIKMAKKAALNNVPEKIASGVDGLSDKKGAV